MLNKQLNKQILEEFNETLIAKLTRNLLSNLLGVTTPGKMSSSKAIGLDGHYVYMKKPVLTY